jgi:hypothetical protein
MVIRRGAGEPCFILLRKLLALCIFAGYIYIPGYAVLERRGQALEATKSNMSKPYTA